MFIGHIAVGFGAKKFAPRTGLAPLIAAPILLDLVFPVFFIFGLERVRVEPGNTVVTPFNFEFYPFSHSLLASIGWATLFAGGYWIFRRYTAGAIAIWIGVVSHWILDVITHRPDMPLYPGCDTLVGLGLWNSRAGTIIVEAVLFVAGVWMYKNQTRPLDKIGVYGFWSFVSFLILLYLGNLFGPPPDSAQAFGVVGVAVWLFVLWVWWFDKHRVNVEVKIS